MAITVSTAHIPLHALCMRHHCIQYFTEGTPPTWLIIPVQAIREVLLLDAGLNCRGAYLTDPEAAAGLGRWCRSAPLHCVSLHGTPRQWGAPLGWWGSCVACVFG